MTFIGVFVGIVILTGIVALSVYVGWNLIRPEVKAINDVPENYSLRYEEISIVNAYDGVTLSGWWIPAQRYRQVIDSRHTVIFAHGYGENRVQKEIDALRLARRLTEEGFNVLMFDFRGSGQSEGNIVTVGALEKYDLLAAVDFVKHEKHADTIALIGWSMGAVSAILSGIESNHVSTIIADSPFSNLREYLKENLSHWSGLPKFPFTFLILALMPLLIGLKPEMVNPLAAVKQLKGKKLLLIHSKADPAIPYMESERIFEAATNYGNVELWLTEDAKHICSYVVEAEAYEEKVLQWLNE